MAELSHINWQVGHIDLCEILKVDRVPAFTLQETKTHTHTLSRAHAHQDEWRCSRRAQLELLEL